MTDNQINKSVRKIDNKYTRILELLRQERKDVDTVISTIEKIIERQNNEANGKLMSDL